MSEARAKIQLEIRALVARSAELEPEAVRDSATFVGELGLESVELVRLVCRVERAFGIALDAAALAPVRTVADLVSVVETRLQSQDAPVP